MKNKILYLSIMLLTLAPSLHGASPKRKGTYAGTVAGLACLQPLSPEIEAEEKNAVNGASAQCVSPETARRLGAAAAIIQKQPIAQQTDTDLPFPEAPAAEATPVEPAPARPKAKLPQGDQLLATADRNNPYVRWAALQAELEIINQQIKIANDPNAAFVEGDPTPEVLNKKRKDLVRQIALQEFKESARKALEAGVQQQLPTKTRNLKSNHKELLEAASKRYAENIENKIAKAKQETKRTKQQERKKVFTTLGLTNPSGMSPEDGLDAFERLNLIAALTQTSVTGTELSDWQQALYEFTSKDQRNVVEKLTTAIGCSVQELPEILTILEADKTLPPLLLRLNNLPDAPQEDSRIEYQKNLSELRNKTRSFPDKLKGARDPLLERIRYEQENHRMAAGTWGDSFAALSLWGKK